ncbi:MAG: metal-dependent transcriptional regulator [Clostridia bacterium]|nr:metal-dependent transcriptional regulator [Clostridia bacterium]
MELRESAQNYLESILVISKRQEVVRATDICAYFGYSRPTVSVALKHFRESGLINVDVNNHITLTQEGLEVATSMYERHTALTQMLMQIGVPKEIAVEDACKIEHDLSPETFECLKRYFEAHKAD